MTCSTCDGYEFVPGDDDLLVSCPDCPPKVRCVVHGRIVSGDGTCCDCRREVRRALPLVVDLTLAAARAAAIEERSVLA